MGTGNFPEGFRKGKGDSYLKEHLKGDRLAGEWDDHRGGPPHRGSFRNICSGDTYLYRNFKDEIPIQPQGVWGDCGQSPKG